MKDLEVSGCTNWSPGAFGPSKYENERSEVALLCFTLKGSNQCWVYDDAKKKMRKFRAKTNHSHYEAPVGSFQGRPFTVGSSYPANLKTEVYKQETDRWETLADFPFWRSFTRGGFTNPQSITHYGLASTDSRGSTDRYTQYLFSYGIFARSIHTEAF